MQRVYTIGYGNVEKHEILYRSQELEFIIDKMWGIVTKGSSTQTHIHLMAQYGGMEDKCIAFSQEDRFDLMDVDYDEFFLCITKDNEFI